MYLKEQRKWEKKLKVVNPERKVNHRSEMPFLVNAYTVVLSLGFASRDRT